jgi:hypothetical protein
MARPYLLTGKFLTTIVGNVMILGVLEEVIN